MVARSEGGGGGGNEEMWSEDTHSSYKIDMFGGRMYSVVRVVNTVLYT